MRIDEQTIDNIQEFLDRGCAFAGTEENLNDIVADILVENKFAYPYADELEIVDSFSNEITDRMSLINFVEQFWDRAVECFINVLRTEE